MKNRQPFSLKTSLAAWNLFLSVFSFMGALRTVPHLLNNLYQFGFYYTTCAAAPGAYGLGASGMWVTLFIFSKIPELVDTAFIVLRKKPLIFLHWYVCCWHDIAREALVPLMHWRWWCHARPIAVQRLLTTPKVLREV